MNTVFPTPEHAENRTRHLSLDDALGQTTGPGPPMPQIWPRDRSSPLTTGAGADRCAIVGAVTSRRLTPRGEERRAEIISHATHLFAANGYHPTSVTEVVDSVGVGKGSFYWYFESKEQLLLEILKQAQQSLRRAQQEALVGESDPVGRIALGIRASLRWSAEHRDVSILISFASTDNRFTEALARGEATAVADIMRHVRDGIATGQIREVDDPLMFAHAILGATTQLARVFIQDRGLDADDVADNAIAFVRDGLLVT